MGQAEQEARLGADSVGSRNGAGSGVDSVGSRNRAGSGAGSGADSVGSRNGVGSGADSVGSRNGAGLLLLGLESASASLQPDPIGLSRADTEDTSDDKLAQDRKHWENK